MSPLTITIGNASDSSQRAVVRRLGEILLALSVLVIFFQGLFPFDFTTQHRGFFGGIGSQFEFTFGGHTSRRDVFVNLLFFMPFGFSLAAVVRRRSGGAPRWRLPIVIAAIAGLAFSTGIELAQVFLPGRVASLSDIVANTIGGAIGGGVFVAIGDFFFSPVARFLLRWKRLVSARNMAIVTAIYALAIVCLPLGVTKPGNLAGWTASLPLTIGNEMTGSRPWEGLVAKVALSDRALSAEEALLISANQPPKSVAPTLMASYKTVGRGPYVDETGHCPPLKWTGVNDFQLDDLPAIVGHGLSLRTENDIGTALGAMAQNNQFSLIAWLSTTNGFQSGPARIVAAENMRQRMDFLIAQDGNDLVIRINAAQFHVRGEKPELVIGGLFPMPDLQCLILSYSGTSLTVYLNGNERGRLDLTPETSVIRKFYPREYFRLHLDAVSATLYSVLYRVLALAPLGALLAGWIILSQDPIKQRRNRSIGALIVIVIIFETVLAILDPGGLHWSEPLVSIMVGVVTMALVLFRHGLFWRIAKA